MISLKAKILRADGIKYKTKGYANPEKKVEIESFIKITCVFSYTAQKQDIKYQ